jgi:2-dehydro-3-deoxygluconokinase
MTKKYVGFGELLLHLNTVGFQRMVQARQFDIFYTGAEANVAVSLANYGVDCSIVSKVPDNTLGQACINFIRQYGIDTSNILRGGKRLGVFYTETGASQRASDLIYDRAGSSFSELLPEELDWPAIFQNKDWFHFSGTAPALAPQLPQVLKQACATARENHVTVSCDLNYRKKLWSPEQAQAVMKQLMQNVDVLICNEEDAQKSLGIDTNQIDVTLGKLDPERYQALARMLHETYGFKAIAFTLRESISATFNNWSALLFDGSDFYLSKKYDMYVVDRVGGGDSFCGGLIYGLLSGFESQKVIEFASAASCLKHSIPGDFNHVSATEVERLIAGDGSGRIQR